jgi:hypothetical protein
MGNSERRHVHFDKHHSMPMRECTVIAQKRAMLAEEIAKIWAPIVPTGNAVDIAEWRYGNVWDALINSPVLMDSGLP